MKDIVFSKEKTRSFTEERELQKWGTAKSAGMVKLVDTPGLGPGALCHAGSSPAARKKYFYISRTKGQIKQEGPLFLT